MDMADFSPSATQYTGLLSPTEEGGHSPSAATSYQGGERDITEQPSTFAMRPAKDLAWSDVNFSVPVEHGICARGDVKQKTILSNCWGVVRSRELCAILGPSGSGKTSLLNIIAGRTIGNGVSVDCKLYVNGQQVAPSRYRKCSAYLTQVDGLMPTTTPREALAFSAHLRLPPNKANNKSEIDKLVTSLLTVLDLTDCADVLIGGGLIQGISGGKVCFKLVIAAVFYRVVALLYCYSLHCVIVHCSPLYY
jgi:ABC-type glutathione transport system ATPase component